MTGTRNGIRAIAAVAVFAAASSGEAVVGRTSAAAPAPRQSSSTKQTPGLRDDDPVRIGAELVLLDVSVTDKENRPKFDLDKSKFAVSEDGSPQTISFFSKEEAPVSLGLVIDASGSMRPKIETVVQAVTNLIKGNRPKDETAVIEFKDDVQVVEEFTTDERDAQDALEGVVANGQSALIDAVKLSAEYVEKEGHHRRKALLVVTDGLERGSYYSYEQISELLKKLDVRLYFIGFTSDLDSNRSLFKKSDKNRAEQLLNKLATDSGGRAFFPKDVSELQGISDEVATDLRTVYSIGYYPTNDKRDGSFRKIDVRVVGDGKLMARSRAGYVAERE